MKLELERKRYKAGEPLRVKQLLWDVSTYGVEGEEAVALSPREIADLIRTGEMLYYDERSIVRLKVLRTFAD